MGPLEMIGELCTLDSVFIRGWRWLLSARYRKEIRIRCANGRAFFVVAGVAETVALMLAEVLALFFIVRWLCAL